MCATIHMKAIEQYIPLVMFIVLLNEVTNFKSVDDNLVCQLQIKLFIMLYNETNMRSLR